jgi:two-component system, cell cycle response regulator
MPADRPMKILVADDDRISRRLMERTLQRSGYEVITAADGLDAAYELSKADGPRLALVDWMMPLLDGPGLCRAVRSRHDEPYVYIVLLTARELNEDIVTGLEAGADDYLTKPCQPAELKARLHTGQRILQLEDKLVEAREEMRFKATHDALTSLWDRGAILSLLRSALNRSAHEKFPISLLLCDVDHFKAINDAYGHLAGDEVLREVSSRLLGAVRSTDSVGRYGGEEFLVVLSGCPANHLRSLAEQVRRAIGEVPFSTASGPIAVTLSIGAITIEDWDDSTPIELILNEADTALYQAKRSGRDRVIYADPLLVAR